MSQVLDYNLAGGRRDQIIILAKMYRDLMVNKEITEENIRKVDMLGWAMELVSFRINNIQKYGTMLVRQHIRAVRAIPEDAFRN